MAIFYGDAVSMAANTATKLVDAAEVNRYVYLGGTLERLGFTSSEVSVSSDSLSVTELVLPAGKELWAYSGSARNLRVLVTAIAH
jgi:hypothetical protein